jgi:DNA-binding MarR family transcriptional regulator
MDAGHQVERWQQIMGASNVFSALVNQLVEDSLAEASHRQLSLAQIKLLLLISRPGMRFKVMDVARFLGVTNAAASRSIDRLVQLDLVDRTVTPEDRRAVDLSLTPRAKDLLERFAQARNRELLRRLGPRAPENLERAAALLDELSGLLADPDADGAERCLRCGVHSRETCLLRAVVGSDCAVTAARLDEQAAATP